MRLLIGRTSAVPLQTYADGSLFGERFGTRSPRVLALHGWGRDRKDFAVVLEGMDAISLDLPGFGASPPPESVWGAAEYAAALEPVLAQFPEPPIIVGHSFGGRVATVVAATLPGEVKALILVGVPLLKPDDHAPDRAAVIYRIAQWLHKRGVISDGKMEQEKRKRGSADYRAARGVMRDVLVRAVAETYEELLPLITCPVALLWGEDDREVPIVVAKRAKSLLADVTIEVVPGLGHHVPINAPDRVRATIERWL